MCSKRLVPIQFIIYNFKLNCLLLTFEYYYIRIQHNKSGEDEMIKNISLNTIKFCLIYYFCPKHCDQFFIDTAFSFSERKGFMLSIRRSC